MSSTPPGRAGHFVGLESLIKSELAAARGLDGLTRSMRDASDEVARAAAQASAPSAAVAQAVAPSAGKGAAPGEGSGNELVSGITQAVRMAETPLVTLGANINQAFNRVGGTIIEMFHRIDAAMKFPSIDNAITRVKNNLGDAFRWGFGAAKKERVVVEGTLAGIEKAINRLIVVMKAFAQSFRDAAAAAGRPAEIVQGMAGDLTRATAGVGLFKKAWEGLRGLGVEAPAPPQSKNVPGVGRTIPLAGTPAPRRPSRQQLIDNEATDGANFAIQSIVKATGMLARGLDAVGRRADDGFGRITMRGTKAGEVLRALDIALGPVNQFKVLFSAVAGVSRGVVGMGQAVWRAKSYFSSFGDVAGKSLAELYSEGNLLKGVLTKISGTAIRVSTLGLVNPLKKAKADAGTLAPSMDRANSATGRMTASVTGLGKEIAVALGVFGLVYKVTSGVKDFFFEGVKGASDLAEATSAAKVTFGKFNSVVSGQAKQMAKEYGLSQKSQLEVAAGFGEMAMGAGMAQGKAAEFANTFTRLAADLNSRKNFAGGFEEAAGKISAALAGESEPLRRLGVTIDEDAVKAKAMAMGLASSTKAISNQAEMAARAALIQEGLASASGDLARTSGSAANQFRKAGGGMANFGIAIGEVLLPAVASGTMAFNDLLATVVEVFEANKPMIESWGKSAAWAMDMVGVGARNLGDFWEIAKLKAIEFGANTLASLAVLPENLAILGGWIRDNWLNLFVDLGNVILTFVKNAATNLWALGDAFGKFLLNPTKGFQYDWESMWKPMLDGFEATTEQFPDFVKPQLISMEKEQDKVWARIAAKEARRKKDIAGDAEVARKPAADLAKAEKAKKGKDFADLAEVGSKEAYSAIVKHQFGSKDDTSKRIEKNTGDALRVQQQQLVLMRKQGAAPAFQVAR